MVTVISCCAKRRFGVGVVPGLAQMRQVARGGRDRRDARHFRRRVVRQNRRAAVHARVAQPAFCARDQADRRGGATAARHFADHERRLGFFRHPGQGQVAGRQFIGVRQVDEGRQQRQLFHACRGLITAAPAARRGRIFRRRSGPGSHTTGRCGWCPGRYRWQIAGKSAAHSSTSAGARMDASCLSFSFGRRTPEARQPRWLRVPLNGAEPTTLPVRRTAGGIKAFLQHDAAAFVFRAHRFDAEVLAHDLGAAFVHHAGGRADIGVGMAGQVFLGKVDQAALRVAAAPAVAGRRQAWLPSGSRGRRPAPEQVREPGRRARPRAGSAFPRGRHTRHRTGC